MVFFNPLTAVGVVDGRYHQSTTPLGFIVSEAALIKYRLTVEIEWFIFLTENGVIGQIPEHEKNNLRSFYSILTVDDCEQVKFIEGQTLHDVKAVEYYIKQKMSDVPSLAPLVEWVHFGCTSEDINNLAYGLMLKDVRALAHHYIDKIHDELFDTVATYRDLPMLARTHGQPASPTTLGKEFAVFLERLNKISGVISRLPITGKMNGATGNYNAHIIAFPGVEWVILAEKFVFDVLELDFNILTTQIEPHDDMADLFFNFTRLNNVLVDLCRDMWHYISLDYFNQEVDPGATGSSTMPHKVNPIDFENAEGNLKTANALLIHLATQLPISRLQRDLVDSTTLRTIGTAFGHAVIGYQSFLKGFNKVEPSVIKIKADLNDHPEVLAEAIQTVMRRYGIQAPYEQLKKFTRGKEVTRKSLIEFVSAQPLPDEVKQRLYDLTPETYTGLANELCDVVL